MSKAGDNHKKFRSRVSRDLKQPRGLVPPSKQATGLSKKQASAEIGGPASRSGSCSRPCLTRGSDRPRHDGFPPRGKQDKQAQLRTVPSQRFREMPTLARRRMSSVNGMERGGRFNVSKNCAPPRRPAFFLIRLLSNLACRGVGHFTNGEVQTHLSFVRTSNSARDAYVPAVWARKATKRTNRPRRGCWKRTVFNCSSAAKAPWAAGSPHSWPSVLT